MANGEHDTMNMGFSIWVAICVFVCFWLWSTFTKGRRQFQNNLHVIEDGLRRMQEDIELRQREKSIGCVEDVEDISEFLKKFYEEGEKERKEEKVSDTTCIKETVQDEKEKTLINETENNLDKENENKTEVEDKKSV